MKISTKNIYFLVLFVILLGGCGTLFPKRSHPARVRDISSGTKTLASNPKNSKPIRGSEAVVALMEKAQKQSLSGDNSAAVATIERALRIEPTNPALWYNLALVKYKQGNCNSAINMARKSNRYAGKGHQLIGKNNQLIKACQ